MKRILFQTLIGLLFFAVGLYLIYHYVKDINTVLNHWLLIPGIILIGIGVFFLMKAGKSDDSVVVKPKLSEEESSGEKKASLIERNNQLVEMWAKTNEARDRLKMLEASADATEKK